MWWDFFKVPALFPSQGKRQLPLAEEGWAGIPVGTIILGLT